MNIKQISLYLIATIAILSLSSCATSKSTANLDDDTIVYGLRKGACFGTCPVYNLFIYKDGRAVMDVTKYMDVLGLQRRQLTDSEMKDLKTAFKGEYFHSLEDDFPSNIPDLPSVWITHHDGKTSKTVFGKEARPEKLLAIQKALEKIAESGKWESLEPQPDKKHKGDKPAPEVIHNELIVQPHPGKLNDTWLSTYKAYGLKLIKKLSPDLEYYLLAFNQESISPSDMITKLKSDPAIRLVEFNKNVEKRPLQGLPK